MSEEQEEGEVVKINSEKDLDFSEYSNREISYFKRIIKEIDMFSRPNLRHQIFLFIQRNEENKWVLNNKTKFNFISPLFKMTPECLRGYYLRGEKENSMINTKFEIHVGRNRLLSNEEEKEIINDIKTAIDNNRPYSHHNLKCHIEEKTKKCINLNFTHDFVKRHEVELKTVTARPMEEERNDIELSAITNYFKKLKKFIDQIHPKLLLNCDESSDQQKARSKQTTIIVPKNDNREKFYYSDPKKKKHITFVGGIWSDLSMTLPMIVTTRKTYDDDLVEYGLPNGPLGYLRYSDTGYVKGNLFKKYLLNCVIPDLNKKRLILGEDDAVAGILMDGHVTHVADDVKELLTANNIKYLFIPPHTSHILQPLDLLIFSQWKLYLKKVTLKKELTEYTLRILKGLKAMHLASTPLNIKSAFARAGIHISLNEDDDYLSIFEEKIIEKLRSQGMENDQIKNVPLFPTLCIADKQTVPINNNNNNMPNRKRRKEK